MKEADEALLSRLRSAGAGHAWPPGYLFTVKWADDRDEAEMRVLRDMGGAVRGSFVWVRRDDEEWFWLAALDEMWQAAKHDAGAA